MDNLARKGEGEPAISRPILILAIIGGVLALVLGAINLFGGDDTPVPTPLPAGVAIAPPVVTPAPTGLPSETEVFEIFEGRDPFKPLVGEGGSGGGAAATAAPGSGATPTATPGSVLRPSTTPKPQREGVQVEVLSVASDSKSATVRVGSTVHERAKPGQTLSSGVALVSIDGKCVNFRRDGKNFTLCEGEQVLK